MVPPSPELLPALEALVPLPLLLPDVLPLLLASALELLVVPWLVPPDDELEHAASEAAHARARERIARRFVLIVVS
jgi:hypothetical protein